MKRVPIRVEPISTYLERCRKGPIYPVIVAGDTVYVSGLPPFDPETGQVKRLPFVRQADCAAGRDGTRADEAVPGSCRLVA